MSKILVTGSAGFIGERLCSALTGSGRETVRVVRRNATEHDQIAVGDIGPDTHWEPALQGVNAIVHLAARAHILKDTARDPLEQFRATNTQGTLRLARAAVDAGVRRFIYISSIGVHGGHTTGQAFRSNSPAHPHSPYARSKWEAEQALFELGAESGMEIVSVRPPLVYGAGARGNFPRLVRLVERGLPIPLGSVRNRRDFISVDNLVDFLMHCLQHPSAAHRGFVIADGQTVSTAEFVQLIAAGLDRPARLLPIPTSFLRLGTQLVGKASLCEQLCDDLQVNIDDAVNDLGWQAPLTPDDAMAREMRLLRRSLGKH